ncbi:MAG: Gfo/Idh/MocA family oxidoreductase [Caldilineales bacterium]|nr:Gfo/Idh/MocA family oxidoreductase [Caldilineales bacterium]
MSKSVRLGVVGCGLASGLLHGSGYRSLDEIELVGFTDRERNFEKKTVPMAKDFGVNAYRNIDEMLEDDSIEAIDVCVMEPGHYEMTKKALLAGKHVLCEKAFTDSLPKARELVALAKEVDRKLMVCYNYRYMETVMELKSRIDAGEFGEFAFISICGHGYTFHHSIDLLRFLCGEVVSVSAKFTIDGKPFLYPLGDWVYTAPFAKAAIFEFANGALGTVTGTDKLANNFPLMSLTYAGVKAQAAYPDLIGDMDHIVAEGSLFNKTFPLILAEFADAVINDRTPAITGVDGVRALELEEAILRSNNLGVSVKPYLIINE